MAIKVSNQITFTEINKIIEIKEYYATTRKPELQGTEVWTTDIPSMTPTNKYLWNYEETIYSLRDPERTGAVIIGVYGEKGQDGIGISAIDNYYCVTTEPSLPDPPVWVDAVPELSPTNKYLWNYEVITYTNNDTKQTEPAIIGAYGDSGADAVDFQIYSVDGFEFGDSLTSIELKTATIKDGNVITSGVTYQWYWWNNGSTLDDKYEIIPNATSSTLTVDVTDLYALAGLKCKMTYDEIPMAFAIGSIFMRQIPI